jgi:hypothetical protein
VVAVGVGVGVVVAVVVGVGVGVVVAVAVVVGVAVVVVVGVAMIYPPKPMDPNKDFFMELVRYTKEHHRYMEALRLGYNDHGPWQQVERKPSVPAEPIAKHIETNFEDPSEEYYWDRMRSHDDYNSRW